MLSMRISMLTIVHTPTLVGTASRTCAVHVDLKGAIQKILRRVHRIQNSAVLPYGSTHSTPSCVVYQYAL